jgi:hypothetical protein
VKSDETVVNRSWMLSTYFQMRNDGGKAYATDEFLNLITTNGSSSFFSDFFSAPNMWRS